MEKMENTRSHPDSNERGKFSSPSTDMLVKLRRASKNSLAEHEKLPAHSIHNSLAIRQYKPSIKWRNEPFRESEISGIFPATVYDILLANPVHIYAAMTDEPNSPVSISL